MAKKPSKQSHIQKSPPPQSSTSQPASIQSPTTLDVPPQKSIWQLLRHRNSRIAVQLTVLSALYSQVSQLVLSPVYGSVPSGLYHKYGLYISVFVAYGLRGHLPSSASRILPSFCFWIPTIQFVLFQFSSTLGNPFGPLITELLTFYPLLVLSIHTGILLLDDLFVDQPSSSDSPFSETAPAMSLFFLFIAAQRSVQSWLPKYIGSNLIMSRLGLQLLIAVLYAIVVPQSILWPAIPSIALTMTVNPHLGLTRTNEVANNTLALSDFSLLDRHDSISGYISVLQDNKNHFRVMRCDHSILGGEWILPPQTNPTKPERKVAEPIYAIFTMLEAVRLVEPPPSTKPKPDTDKRALNIGLGIGTAPSALIHHGINTTIYELDPAVHFFAMRYFNLPKDHRVYIGDAVDVVAYRATLLSASSTTTSSKQDPHLPQRYDYIIHDVFTGGVEPASLFTHEFLSDLHTLLDPETGVIAINYAGDLSMPSSSLIYRTITSVFGACRVFREDEDTSTSTSASPPSRSSRKEKVDFTNMVFFCRHRSQSSHPLTFRKPLEADFLGSDARREFLVPKYEISPEKFERPLGRGEVRVLDRRNIKVLDRYQKQSAIGHWRVMRTVLPDVVWENW